MTHSLGITVYVAGPMTTGDLIENIRNAINTAETIWEHGFIPFVPHLMHFYDIQHPHSYKEWIAYDLEWLRKCDAVFRMEGESNGADLEVTEARTKEIPVFFTFDGLYQWFNRT